MLFEYSRTLDRHLERVLQFSKAELDSNGKAHGDILGRVGGMPVV